MLSFDYIILGLKDLCGFLLPIPSSRFILCHYLGSVYDICHHFLKKLTNSLVDAEVERGRQVILLKLI